MVDFKQKLKNSPFGIAKKLFTDNTVDVGTNGFMINSILSFIPSSILWAVSINKYIPGLPVWSHNTLISAGINKNNPPAYINFIKGKSEKTTELQQKISNSFCTNPLHSNQIIELLKKQNIIPEHLFGLKQGKVNKNEYF